MGEVVNLRDRLQAAGSSDHGCIMLTKGRCPLCQVRSLDEYRRQRMSPIELPADCEMKGVSE